MTIGAKEILPKGNVEKTAGQGIQYYILTNEVKSVPNEYNLIYKHEANILESVVMPGYDYTLKLKILTGNEVIVPTEGNRLQKVIDYYWLRGHILISYLLN